MFPIRDALRHELSWICYLVTCDRGMNSPSTVILPQRDKNSTSPTGAFDGSRGFDATH
jgi:hypothetical protein